MPRGRKPASKGLPHYKRIKIAKTPAGLKKQIGVLIRGEKLYLKMLNEAKINISFHTMFKKRISHNLKMIRIAIRMAKAQYLKVLTKADRPIKRYSSKGIGRKRRSRRRYPQTRHRSKRTYDRIPQKVFNM